MLTFDPKVGLSAPTTAETREEVEAAFVSAFQEAGGAVLNTGPETPAGQLIDSITAMIADKNAELLYLMNQFNPRVASGIWQAAIGQIYFMSPTTATNAVAECTCTGLTGTTIPAGAIIQSEADNTQWVCLSSVTIPSSGSIDTQFQCLTAGEIIAAANTLTMIVTVTPGWDSVTNAAASTRGTLAESRQSFEQRRFNSVAINARGSLNALYGALADIDGVVDSVVLENDTASSLVKLGVTIPAHSIYIGIVGGNNSDIARAIYQNKDAGCGTSGNTTVTYTDTEIPYNPVYTYSIQRPNEEPFGVQVTIYKTLETPADIVTLIKSAVMDNFNGDSSLPRVGMAQVVYASRFYADVIAAGADSLVSIQIAISGGAYGESVTINADTEPTLSADDITVTVLE